MTPAKRQARKRRPRVAGTGQGLPPEVRAAPPPGSRESVEDPLEDWAEDDAAADRWLLEREGGDVQRDER